MGGAGSIVEIDETFIGRKEGAEAICLMRKPFQEPRLKAPETGSAFDFVRIEVECPNPQCGKKLKEPIAELVVNDTVTCGLCGTVIDLTTQSWQSRLAQEAETFKKIKPPNRA